MRTDARNALRTIRRCLANGRYRLTRHFRVRLAERGAFRVDVAAVIDAPASARGNGLDEAGRSRWIVPGEAADGATMGLVCAIGRDDAGELTVFVTAFLGGLTTPTQTSNAAPRTLTDDVPFSARRPDGRTLFLLVPAKWCELDASGEVLFKPEAAQCLDRVQAMAQQVRDKPSRA